METEFSKKYIKQTFDEFVYLLKMSEERIDRTNAMVLNLSETVKNLTNTYERHIQTLTDNRDMILRQNKSLIDTINSLQIEYSKERERYDNLIKVITSLAKSSQNINIK